MIRCPSATRLVGAFRDLDRPDAFLIRLLCRYTDDPIRLIHLINRRCPDTARCIRSMFGDPYYRNTWRRTVVLHAIDRILGTAGVEALGPTDPEDPPYEYCNPGDPYVTTLVYTRATDTIRIGCWGDLVETHDKRGTWPLAHL